MPVPHVQAVVAQVPRSHPLAEVVEGWIGVPEIVFVVADRGSRPILETTPAGPVTVGVLLRCTVLVDVVTRGEYERIRMLHEERVHESGRLFISGTCAAGDIARTDERAPTIALPRGGWKLSRAGGDKDKGHDHAQCT